MYFAFLILSILIWRDGCSRGPAGYGADSGKSRAEAGYRVVQRENAADMDGPKEQRQKPLTDAYIVQDHPAEVSLVYKMFIIFVKYAGGGSGDGSPAHRCLNAAQNGADTLRGSSGKLRGFLQTRRWCRRCRYALEKVRKNTT